MKVVLQRKQASVKIDDQVKGAINKGYVLLVGVADGDEQADIDYLVRKIHNLRIFEDESGRMNRSIEDVSGAILSISQFTLFADTKKEIVQVLPRQGHQNLRLLCIINSWY